LKRGHKTLHDFGKNWIPHKALSARKKKLVGVGFLRGISYHRFIRLTKTEKASLRRRKNF
jgi:hypothetical protein